MEKRKPGGDPIHNEIIGYFRNLYFKRYGLTAEVPEGWVRKMLKDLLTRHSAKGLKRVIDLYFEDSKKQDHHLTKILSSWSINYYLPRARLDPRAYANAEEYNKEVY